MAFAIPVGMQDAESLPSRNGRRGLIALIVLLLILLPLYLWPLRGGLAGLPGASALSGSVRDPRSAAAVAQIPADVWDALMGHTGEPASLPVPKAPRNLTMITHGGGIAGGDESAGGTTGSDTPPAFARGMLAQLGSGDLPGGNPAGGDTAFTSDEFSASTPGGASGGSSGGGGAGGYPGFGNLGPWPGGGHGGGPGGGPRLTSLGPTLGPDDPSALEPTPEPATLALVGSNLALLGVAAWRRRRRRLGVPAPG